MPGKAVIQQKRRVFDDFFKVDELIVSHDRVDGTTGAGERLLVFERGDTVAVLLLNPDSRSVVLVEQFKVPVLVARQRDDPSTSDGWTLETVAGMIEPNETPEAAIIRETMEETGYRIRNPKPIARFFSSPGGTSERIFLYFAEVRETDRSGKGGGDGNEDIRVVHLALDDLFDRIASGAIEDAKLLLAAHWLQDQLRSRNDRKQFIDALGERPAMRGPSSPAPSSAPKSANEPLTLSTVRYAVKNRNGLFVGYKTGVIDRVKDVSLWVNSENTDMMMDRFLGKSVSANIRYLGANKDDNGNVIEDTIEEALRGAVGQRAHVKVGTVLVTKSGALRTSHNVMRIFHVATVEGVGAGRGVKADPTKLINCLDNVLKKADEINNRRRMWFARRGYDSILVPMFGAGDGGLPIEDVAQTIIPAAIEYYQNSDGPTLKEIYFLAFTARARDACDQVLQHYLSNDILAQSEDK